MSEKVTFNIDLKLNGKDVVKQVTMNVDELRAAFDSARSEADRTSASLIRFNQHTETFRNMAEGVQQLASTLNDLTSESRDYSAAMAAANTMAGKSGEDFATLKSQVSELAKTIPIARDELANGLYQVISNGVPEDNWLEYLNQSAKASVGGIANLEEVVKVTSTVIKNYGLSWQDAGEIQDKIQLTAKNGVTSFEQMAQALPRVTANAATLGVSINELMATFATLTGVSGNTAEVSTQLSAIFTALVKPSSEATEMAQQMGIQFDAAAVKAAGGMQNFIQSLDSDVKRFASTSGMLEQEIYGKLFGSAESLRALIPLTGELADKFSENVGAMEGSAGTIDGAFEIMGNTGSAQLQKLKNAVAGIGDALSGAVGWFQPVLNFGSQAGMTAVSVLALRNAFSGLSVSTKLASAATATFGPIVQVARAAMTGATVSATTLSAAIKSLMITSGVGIAVVALTTALNAFSQSAQEAKADSEELKAGEEAYTKAAAEAKVAMDSEIKKLQELIKSNKDTSTEVQRLNSSYGNLFGSHKTAAEWYDTLVKKSQTYVKQIGYEAQAKLLASKLAEKQIQLEDNYAKRRELWKSGGAVANVTKVVGTSSSGATQTVRAQEDTAAYKSLKEEARGLIPDIQALERQLGIATAHLQEGAKALGGSATPSTVPTGATGGGGKGGSITTVQTVAEAPLEEGSVDWYEAKLRELRTKIESTGNEANATAMQKDYEQIAEQLQALKIRIGLEKPEALKEEVEKALDDISIGADLRPAAITKGSVWDKRESWNNAQQRAGQISSDLNAGIIDEASAEKMMVDLNEELQAIGLKPLTVEMDTDEAERSISQLGSVSITSFGSVRDNLQSLHDMTPSTAKDFATAGDSAILLGNAMQQLGSDSAAAKAGMVLAAVGQIVLSFSQALASCKTWVDWVAFGISGIAQVASLVNTVKGFATGGIVGGSSYSGDNVAVRVNSGEMILNRAQQARLFALANGTALLGMASGVRRYDGIDPSEIKANMSKLRGIADGGGVSKEGSRVIVRGRDLVKVLGNETRLTRKGTNIRL